MAESKEDSMIGFIGAGVMASAIAKGFIAAGKVKASEVMLSDISDATLAKHAEAGCKVTKSNEELVGACRLVIIAVKPQLLEGIIKPLAPLFSEKHLVISIAAGVSTSALESFMSNGESVGPRVIRIMPAIPATVFQMGAGACSGSTATDEDMEKSIELFKAVGVVERVPERLMDAITGLSGSGPAFVFMMIEAMADGGVHAGLPRPVALSLAAQTVKGAATMVLESGKHPGVLKDMVCSPAGTTIAGVNALEQRGFRSAAMSAVIAAADRSKELREAAESSKAKL